MTSKFKYLYDMNIKDFDPTLHVHMHSHETDPFQPCGPPHAVAMN